MSARLRLTKDELEAWQASPVTEIVTRYLLDQVAAMEASWARGENWTIEAMLQVQNFRDLAALEWSDIETFYEDRDEQDSESATG